MHDLTSELRAHEIHEKASSYFRTSEQYGYKFLMELKTIRDEKLFKELGFSSFDEYTTINFNYSQRTVNERIQSAEVWGKNYERALASYGKTKTRQVAQLPEKERGSVIENGVPTDNGVKPLDEATTREIGNYQKQLKQKDEEIERLRNKPAEVIEKEVVKEVKITPHDYDGLKSDNNQLSQALKEEQQENQKMRNQLDQWRDEKGEIDKKSKRYDELSAAIKEMEGKMDAKQKRMAVVKDVTEKLKIGNQLIDELSGLIYLVDYEELSRNEFLSAEINKLMYRLNNFIDDFSERLDQTTILEGEIINE